jgi:hypothetical protein
LAQLSGLSLRPRRIIRSTPSVSCSACHPGRYKTFGELNKHVLKPVIAEVNAWPRSASRWCRSSRARRWFRSGSAGGRRTQRRCARRLTSCSACA